MTPLSSDDGGDVLEVMAKRKQATMITRVHGWRGFCPAALSPPRGRRTSSPGSLQHQNYDRTALKPKSLKPVCPNQKGFKNPTDPTRPRSFIISFQFMYCNVEYGSLPSIPDLQSWEQVSQSSSRLLCQVCRFQGDLCCPTFVLHPAQPCGSCEGAALTDPTRNHRNPKPQRSDIVTWTPNTLPFWGFLIMSSLYKSFKR